MNVLNLFKYYKPKYKDKDNLSFYSQEEIYFQKPKEFNDPWDCKVPHITTSCSINTLKDIWFNLKGQNLALAEIAWQEIRKMYPSTQKMQLYFIKHLKKAVEKRRSEIGIFSLSFIPDSELMWSHYASSHSGYMLHFQIDIAQYCANSSLNNVVTLHPVIYRDEREVWDLENYYTNSECHLCELIRFKSNAWFYECEFRLLNVGEYGFIKTPSNWLKSIVIGIETESELQDKLKNIGKDLNVSVLSSVMNEKEYKIDIPGLGINGKDGETCYEEAKDSEMFKF